MMHIVIAVALLVSGCRSERPSARAGTGRYITITTPRGPHRVWIEEVGSSPTLRVLLLHGGPGATHEYFEILERHFPAARIQLIYYDQLGSGRSDAPDDDSLWTIERFVDEVEQVRRALNLTSHDFVLLGHSWGGLLAIEYALAHPDALKGLIVTNMMTSIPLYNRYASEVLEPQLPAGVRDQLHDFEERGDPLDPRWEELLAEHFYPRHVCRLPVWPDSLRRGFYHLNRHVYELMQGPNELGASGRIARWDRTADLPRLTVPTLFIGARWDTMDPQQIEWSASRVPHGSYLYCPAGSHLAMYDDEATWFGGVTAWLSALERGQSRTCFENVDGVQSNARRNACEK